MHLASHLAQARIVDRYRQALRDAAMYPAIHYGLARARIADVHLQAHRGTLARAPRPTPPRAGEAVTMTEGETRARSTP